MDKFKLLDELVKAMGLTPQEVVKHWQKSGAVQTALFSKSQVKKRSKLREQIADSESGPESKSKNRPKGGNLNFMTENDIFEVLKKIISEQAGVEKDDILRSSSFVSLGVDSLDFVEITMIAERTFGISIPDEDVKGKDTVQDILDYLIERKITA